MTAISGRIYSLWIRSMLAVRCPGTVPTPAAIKARLPRVYIPGLGCQAFVVLEVVGDV